MGGGGNHLPPHKKSPINLFFFISNPVMFPGGKQAITPDFGKANDDFPIQTDKGSSTIVRGMVIKR